MDKPIHFLRWGDLNAIKHKEARRTDENTWIHVAPCYKGVYAFPCGFVEPFLLGGVGANRIQPLKINGEMITSMDFYDPEDWTQIRGEYKKILKKLHIKEKYLTTITIDDKVYMGYRDYPKHFTYNGDIWHHLSDCVENKDILDSKHGWVKTSYKAYLKALKKSDTKDRFHSAIHSGAEEHSSGNPHTHPNNFTKDLYEVFIEHIK